MDNSHPALLMVAPNGARRTKVDHPALPMSAAELADDAVSCRAAGAAAIHLHVRGKDGKHLLDGDVYRQAIDAVTARTGGDMVIQITTEAVGMYAPDKQMALVRDVRPDFVSMAIRELVADRQAEPQAARFFKWMRAEKIVPHFILYDEGDVFRLADLCQRGIVPMADPFVLYVLGRYAKNQLSQPEDLTPFLDAAKPYDWPWMVCAFGAQEAACIGRGLGLGGHGRIGFENNLHMPDGSVAPDNAALVQVAARHAEKSRRALMTPDQLREMLATLW